ncbi:hypothetical protein Dsin_014202 [Dipteronia sinensis]|uniref:Uncharacterized protein n=1 Tax=Dipteronia sinensis TaxID=43782 RepID=A0AAE0ALS5_9ROSI|nr:hypothetical protein Dsin_014202 [Dipteronia sinensis]
MFSCQPMFTNDGHAAIHAYQPGPLISKCASDAAADLGSKESKVTNDLVLELQSVLADKSNQLSGTESKLQALVEEVAMLRRDKETP